MRRLQRDLEDIPSDPRALARRLTNRQEAVRQDVDRNIRELVKNRNEPTDAEREAISEPFEARRASQAEIRALLIALSVGRDQADRKRQALEKVERADEALKEANTREVDQRLNESRDALRQLTDAMPDVNRRRQEIQPRIQEARQRMAEVANEVERHLRETAPQPGRLHDSQQAAAELADRLAGSAQKAAEVAADLRAIQVPERLEPHWRQAEGTIAGAGGGPGPGGSRERDGTGAAGPAPRRSGWSGRFLDKSHLPNRRRGWPRR